MVRNWYNNIKGQKGRKAGSKRVNLDILRPKGRRALQATEIYSRKYYKERVKPRVDAALKGKKATRSERLSTVKHLTRKIYESESREVKEEIEDERRALNNDDDDEDGSGEETGDGDEARAVVVNPVKRQAYVGPTGY